MAVQIKIEDSTYQSRLISLNSNSLFFIMTYNTRDGRWYLDIEDRNKINVISGIKILPLQSMTGKYVNVRTLIGGNIYCIDTRLSGQDINRDNFGTDKQFQLWYYTTEEEEALVNDVNI